MQSYKMGLERIFLVIVCWLAAFFLPAASTIADEKIVIIGNDTGGSLIERTATVAAYRKDGTRVEIRFGYCVSACTLFLGLENMCIDRRVKFGFHGPSSSAYGVALPKEDFEYWSRLMGAHYPLETRKWFLKDSRHRIVGFDFLDGAKLIRQGVTECDAKKRV